MAVPMLDVGFEVDNISNVNDLKQDEIHILQKTRQFIPFAPSSSPSENKYGF